MRACVCATLVPRDGFAFCVRGVAICVCSAALSQLKEANRSLRSQVEGFTCAQAARQAEALGKVKAWGAANGGIRDEVEATKTASERLSAEEIQVSSLALISSTRSKPHACC